jgi:hypothetical protein
MVISFILNPSYQTNDDVGMIYAFSGTGIFTNSTPFTAFSTKIWGLIMVNLYSIFSGKIEIYTLVFYLLIFISNVFIHFKILNQIDIKKFKFWIIFIPLIAMVTINFYIQLQFTMLVVLLFSASYFLLWNTPNLYEKITSIFLLIIASLIRLEMVLIMLVFSGIIHLLAYFFVFKKTNSYLPKNIYYVFAFILLFVIRFIDLSLYTKEEKQFKGFNTYRGDIVDYNVEKYNKNFISNNWGSEELELFKQWFYNDKILYDKNNDYNIIKAKSSNFITKINIEKFNISSIFSQLYTPIFRSILFFLIGVAFLSGNLIKSISYLIVLVIVYILFIFLIGLLFKTAPFRFSFPLFTFVVFYFLGVLDKLTLMNTNNLSKIGFAFLLIGYGLLITKISLLIRKNQTQFETCNSFTNNNILYVRWSEFPFEKVNPWKITTQVNNAKIISMGAFSIHPAVDETIKYFNIKNLTSDIIDKNNVVFVLPNNKSEWINFANSYKKFIRKNYNKNVEFTPNEGINHCFNYSEYRITENKNAKLD